MVYTSNVGSMIVSYLGTTCLSTRTSPRLHISNRNLLKVTLWYSFSFIVTSQPSSISISFESTLSADVIDINVIIIIMAVISITIKLITFCLRFNFLNSSIWFSSPLLVTFS